MPIDFTARVYVGDKEYCTFYLGRFNSYEEAKEVAATRLIDVCDLDLKPTIEVEGSRKDGN